MHGYRLFSTWTTYGIKFGSNWQVSTRNRDVKDAKAEDLTRQPEQNRTAFFSPLDKPFLSIHNKFPHANFGRIAVNAPYPLAKTTLAHALAVSLCLSLIGRACGQYPVRMFVNVNNPYNRNCAYPNAMSAMPGRMSQPVWMAPAPVNFNVMMARANGMYGPAPCTSAFPAGNVNPFLIPAPMSYLPSPEFASFMSSSLPMSGTSDANWMMTSGTMNPLDQQEPSILDRFTSQDDTADGYDYYLSTLASPGGLTPGSPFGYSYAAPPMAGMYPITMANGMNMGGMMMGYMNGNLPKSAGGTGQAELRQRHEWF